MRYVETRRVPIERLEPFPGNARVHDDDALDESVQVNGQYRSVVARRLGDGFQMLAGHGTVEAFQRRGDSDVRVEVIEADDTEARRIVLADNGTSRNASYDERLLLDLIDAAFRDGGLPGTGWDADAYNDLLDVVGSENPFDYQGDPDDVDLDPPADAVTQPGDVWVLGEHRLVCGDSTDPMTWAALMGREQAKMIWTDPPYNVAVAGGTHDPRDAKNHGKGPRIENDSMGDAAFAAFLRAAYDAMLPNLEPGGAVYVCHADTEGINFRVQFRAAGFFLHEVLIWVKQEFVFGRSDYHWQHEPILYGWRPGAGHSFYGQRNQSTTWQIDRPMRSAMEHPTQKPVALPTKAIENSSQRGDLVADPFGGAGSTLVAAHLAGRFARVAELDPAYCDVIARRYQELTGDKPVLERTGEPYDFTADPPCVAA